MLDEIALSVLRDEMSIDIQHLTSKLRSISMSRYEKSSIEALVNFVSSLPCNNPKDKINSVADRYKAMNLGYEFEEFIDSMRHSFVAYSQGGLRDLFLYQENQVWYPKVQLKQELAPNDIHTLCEIVSLYRGCDLSESNNRNYGQSWSTSKEIAREFAFNHYSYQAWFSKNSRCVLSATIYKSQVYYSDQSKYEREVVVDTAKLMDVQICA